MGCEGGTNNKRHERAVWLCLNLQRISGRWSAPKARSDNDSYHNLSHCLHQERKLVQVSRNTCHVGNRDGHEHRIGIEADATPADVNAGREKSVRAGMLSITISDMIVEMSFNNPLRVVIATRRSSTSPPSDVFP